MDRKHGERLMRILMTILLVASLGALAACGGGGGGGTAQAPPTAPGAFSMITPVNNDTGVALSPTLNWGSASGVATYTVQVTTDSTFATITSFQTTTIPAGTTSVLVSGLSNSTVYYWRVIAVNAGGSTTANSAPYAFTTVHAAVPLPSPGAFSMTAPADTSTSVSLSPTLVWGSSSNVTTYTVQVTTDNTFGTITTFESTTVPSGTTSALVSGLSPSTIYYWRVSAVNSAGTTTASGAPYSFTTKKPGDVEWAVSSEPSSFFNNAFGMKINGAQMYLAGYDTAPGDGQFEWRMEKRSLSDGGLVAAFGSTGVVVSNPTLTWTDTAYSVAIDSSYLYVAGYDSLPGELDQEWRIEKRDLTTGALVASFGTSGVVMENNSIGVGADDRVYAIAVDSSPTGTIFAVGFESPSATVTEWRIEARSKIDGALGSSVTTTIGSGDSVPNAVVIGEAEGYMYVVGTDGSGFDTKWRIEKRSLSAPLSLETVTFGTGGVVISNPGAGVDEAMAVALDNNYIYVAGSEFTAGKFRWRIEKRKRTDGSLETNFGASNGWINSNTTTGAIATAVAVDATHLYVAGYDNTAGGSLEWRIEKRDLVTGALDTTFGTSGVVLNSFSNAAAGWDDDIWAIAVDDAFIYVAGSETWPNTAGSRWRIEKIVK